MPSFRANPKARPCRGIACSSRRRSDKMSKQALCSRPSERTVVVSILPVGRRRSIFETLAYDRETVRQSVPNSLAAVLTADPLRRPNRPPTQPASRLTDTDRAACQSGGTALIDPLDRLGRPHGCTNFPKTVHSHTHTRTWAQVSAAINAHQPAHTHTHKHTNRQVDVQVGKRSGPSERRLRVRSLSLSPSSKRHARAGRLRQTLPPMLYPSALSTRLPNTRPVSPSAFYRFCRLGHLSVGRACAGADPGLRVAASAEMSGRDEHSILELTSKLWRRRVEPGGGRSEQAALDGERVQPAPGAGQVKGRSKQRDKKKRNKQASAAGLTLRESASLEQTTPKGSRAGHHDRRLPDFTAGRRGVNTTFQDAHPPPLLVCSTKRAAKVECNCSDSFLPRNREAVRPVSIQAKP
ncbi:unnamed protein product [Protopolystoma xenopodis]|uniref:Uncharacterized protein n=1 Tax=Protopolystoma xenopodis TaxID=117903 RepID=A0A448XGJ7_9PLAT|nr:unnamed protein product [Protopolystoma xenopodis]